MAGETLPEDLCELLSDLDMSTPYKKVMETLKEHPEYKNMKNGRKPMIWSAITWNRLDMIKLLREQKTDVTQVDEIRNNSIAFAVSEEEDNDEVALYILNWVKDEAPELLTRPNKDGETPLTWAKRFENKFVQKFIEEHATPCKEHDAIRDLLLTVHKSIDKNDMATLKKVIQDAPDAVKNHDIAKPALEEVVLTYFRSSSKKPRQKQAILTAFAEAGVSFTGTDDRNMTLLFFCSDYIHNVVRELLVLNKKHNAGLDVNAVDKFGRNCLHMAAKRAKKEDSEPTRITLALLLDAGVNVDLKDEDGVTPKSILEALPEGEGVTEIYKRFKANKFEGIVDDLEKYRDLKLYMEKGTWKS